jgi:HlyD family secretion protein
MTFFVPETAAGRIALGTEVRLRLDAAPNFVIPARVSYVASSAQFTPKSVETASERQKLMFRVKAQVDRQVLERHASQVKAGVPGVAWVRLDRRQPWPPELALRSAP